MRGRSSPGEMTSNHWDMSWSTFFQVSWGAYQGHLQEVLFQILVLDLNWNCFIGLTQTIRWKRFRRSASLAGRQVWEHPQPLPHHWSHQGGDENHQAVRRLPKRVCRLPPIHFQPQVRPDSGLQVPQTAVQEMSAQKQTERRQNIWLVRARRKDSGRAATTAKGAYW